MEYPSRAGHMTLQTKLFLISYLSSILFASPLMSGACSACGPLAYNCGSFSTCLLIHDTMYCFPSTMFDAAYQIDSRLSFMHCRSDRWVQPTTRTGPHVSLKLLFSTYLIEFFFFFGSSPSNAIPLGIYTSYHQPYPSTHPPKSVLSHPHTSSITTLPCIISPLRLHITITLAFPNDTSQNGLVLHTFSQLPRLRIESTSNGSLYI